VKKIILSLILLIQLSFSATPEQVEQYVMLSQADRELLEMEQIIEEIIPPNSAKSTTIISIRFNEYLTKHFSEDEITELIELYKNPLLQVLRELDYQIPKEELREFNLSIEKNPLSKKRLNLNKKIIENMFDEEDLKNIRYGLQEKVSEVFGGEQESDLITKEEEEILLKQMREELMLPLLYTTQTLSVKELTELYQLTSKSILKKANKVEINGKMYTIEYFLKDILTGMMNKSMANLDIKEGV